MHTHGQTSVRLRQDGVMGQPDVKGALARLVDSAAFTGVVLTVIVANAVVLGLQTYDGLVREHGRLLDVLNDAFLAFFVVELALRLAAYGRRPQDFFRNGWNVFDFVVVAAAFVPGLRENTTLLRLARLVRVVRVVRLLPDLRVLVLAIARSLPPLVSMIVLTTLILFFYGMVGWILFADQDPQAWGDIGQAMLTLFVMLTLENFPATLERGMDIHTWSWVYFVSFVLVAALIVLNVLIGVVLHSMEEAREIERRRSGEAGRLHERIANLRAALDDLEHEVARSRGRDH
jgi:voltage-gated sodium channel